MSGELMFIIFYGAVIIFIGWFAGIFINRQFGQTSVHQVKDKTGR